MVLKHYLKYFGICLIFYLFLFVCFFLFATIKGNLNLFSQNSLLQFDAVLYQKIKNSGYQENWLCAFFPAFPFLWKLLNLSILGISVFNSLIFCISVSAIAYLYKLNLVQQLFFLSIPSLIFMFVPYSEALFYFSSTLLIIGLNKNKTLLIIIGLLLCSLIRPTTFIFIPAILGTFYFSQKSIKQTFIKSSLPVLTLIIGLLITVSVHFYYTNKWFVFFEAQKLWANYLHFPKLPFTSWGGDPIVRYDGSVLAISIACIIYCFKLLKLKLKKDLIKNQDLIFSLLYISGTSLLILAYRDGNLYSLNRFIFATPFLIISCCYFFSNYEFKIKHVWFVLFSSELFWLLFNSYNHIHNFLLFSTISIYFILMLFTKHTNKLIANASIISLIILNSYGFIKLFNRFISNNWVG